jgi:hypothetical protein
MSAFMVSNVLIQQVVTAILQNTDRSRHHPNFSWSLGRRSADRYAVQSGRGFGKRLFGMNAAAIRARYGFLPQRPVFKFASWTDATPVEQFKAIRCLLYQSCEGTVPNGRLYGELNRVAGELAQRIVQDSPEYEKAPWS